MSGDLDSQRCYKCSAESPTLGTICVANILLSLSFKEVCYVFFNIVLINYC